SCRSGGEAGRHEGSASPAEGRAKRLTAGAVMRPHALSLRARSFFAELNEYTCGGRRVQEGNALSFRTHARHFVDQANSPSPATAHGGLQIIHRKADVVDPRPPALHETADRRLRTLGLQQLYQRLARFQPGYASAVGVIQLHLGQSQNVAVEREDLLEVPDRNSHVSDTRTCGWAFIFAAGYRF